MNFQNIVPQRPQQAQNNPKKQQNQKLKKIDSDIFKKYKDKKNLTNNVIKIVKDEQIIYCIPVYCRLKLKNVASVDFQSLSGLVNVDIIISVYYGGLLQQQRQLLTQKMYLMFPKDPPIQLKGDQFQVTFKQNKQQHLYNFTIRKFLETQVRSQIYLAPFEKLIQILTLEFQKIVQTKGEKKISYIFNLMDYREKQNQNIKISLGSQKRFGMYTFAEKLMRAYYTGQFCLSKQNLNLKQKKDKNYQNTQTIEQKNNSDSKQDEGKKQKLKNLKKHQHYKQNFKNYLFEHEIDQQQKFLIQKQNNEQSIQLNKQGSLLQKKTGQKTSLEKQNNQPLKQQKANKQLIQNKQMANIHFAHFIMPMYKQPLNVALKIFFPLIILGIINIGIPYQDKTERAKQVANAAALMISFIALVPTIREGMGHGDGVSFIQVCVFLQACTTILTLIHIVWNRSDTNIEIDLGLDGIIILNIVITCIVFVAIMGMSIWHQFYMKSYVYHSRKGKKKVKQKKVFFNRRLWKNKECDTYFQKKYYQKNYDSYVVQCSQIQNKDNNKDKQNAKDKQNGKVKQNQQKKQQN